MPEEREDREGGREREERAQGAALECSDTWKLWGDRDLAEQPGRQEEKEGG